MKLADLDLETVWSDPEFFGLTTITPVQRAMCRVLDHRPLGELASHPDVLSAMGDCTVLDRAPRDCTAANAARCGKSQFAAVFAFTRSQTVDLSLVGRGDRVRIPIVSLTRDLGGVVFRHLRETVLAKPIMRALLAEEPTAERMVFRHPSGRAVEVTVTPASKAGGRQIGGYLGSEIYDEATRMMGEVEGVAVALDEMWAATESRLLPGAQRLNLGTPWAPQGPIYEQVTRHWRQPSVDLVVVKATGAMLNPSWWTPERCAALARKNPGAFAADGLAEFRNAETSPFDYDQVEGTARELNLGLYDVRGRIVVTDPSQGRGDAWTYAVCDVLVPIAERLTRMLRDPVTGAETVARDATGAPIEDDLDQRPIFYLHSIGGIEGTFSGTISGDEIVDTIAALAKRTGATRVVGDQNQSLMLSSAFASRRVPYVSIPHTSPSKTVAYEILKRRLSDGTIVIERGAAGDKVRRQMLALRERFTASGAVAISARGTGVDDYASTLVTMAHADAEGLLHGSPLRRRNGVSYRTENGWG